MGDIRPVGVFDSGVGGVSVLREAVRLLPRERFVYYGDCLHAPYGEREEEEIRKLAVGVTGELLAHDVKALLIACNTATSAAVGYLRKQLSIPVVGMEPALKPASQMRKQGKVLVLATPATLRLGKFQHLMEQYGQETIPLPCAGLMEFAERGELAGAELEAYLDGQLARFRGTVDVAVLGCTHYVFLREAIGRALPGVPLVDGNLGTVRRLHFLLEQGSLLSDAPRGGVEFLTSGGAQDLARMRRLFEM